jgi:pimeloyl-ACP methyl ester carboxylesterase
MTFPFTCVGCSGFFLRADSWSNVASRFRKFICVDDCRDNPQLTLADYVNAVCDAMASAPSPYILIGHSFGGWLVAAIAARLQEPVDQVVLLSALGFQLGRSATEVYADSNQHFMHDVCRLNLRLGTLDLAKRSEFVESVFGTPSSVHIARHESLALITDSIETPPRPPSRQCLYVVTNQDHLSTPEVQIQYSRHHQAKVLHVQGNHFSTLAQPSWLGAIIS